MTSIWQDIENLILDPIDKEAHVVASDLAAWAKSEIQAGETAIANLWNGFKPIVTSVLPSQYAILKDLEAKAQTDVSAGDYSGLVPDVLQLAEAEEVAFVAKMSTEALTVILIALHLQRVGPPAASPVAAKPLA